jgi:4,5-dihydroxyphthalate decarboxylase
VTTGAWIRGILAEDHGVDLSRIQWVTFEEAHVAEFKDPPNVQRAAAGKDISAMLLAASSMPRSSARFRPIPGAAGDPRPGSGRQEVGREARRGPAEPPGRGEEHPCRRRRRTRVYERLLQSKQAAGNPPMLPHGVEANRRNLEVAIDCAYKQRMIPRRFTVDELFE